jgi:hypothetical protein
MVKGRAFLERFWSRVDDRAGPEACWPWCGWVNDGGYGIVALGPRGGRAIHIRAHRLAYELTSREPIPATLTIDHLCRVRHCVNPAHLEVVTKGVNVRRGATTAARHAETMVCPYGHSYDAANTVWKVDGSRGCRECMRRRCREYQARRRIDGGGGRPLHGPPRR